MFAEAAQDVSYIGTRAEVIVRAERRQCCKARPPMVHRAVMEIEKNPGVNAREDSKCRQIELAKQRIVRGHIGAWTHTISCGAVRDHGDGCKETPEGMRRQTMPGARKSDDSNEVDDDEDHHQWLQLRLSSSHSQSF